MEVKIKKLNNEAVIPTRANPNDAGLDLTAISRIYDTRGNIAYGTGISIEIPKGYVGLLFPRSSISKYDLLLSNSVGVIDSDYRGEIIFKFKPLNSHGDFTPYNIGDRIGQLIIIPYPNIELVEVNNLSNTTRGDGGFGSTGV